MIIFIIADDLEVTSLSGCTGFDADTTENHVPSAEVNNNVDAEQPVTSTPNPPSAVISQSIIKRLEEEKKQREKVEEWKNFITGKLDKLNEKSDFDIHYYGSQVMDNMSMDENKKFTDVVQGKSGSEVCRYFLAVLQLACTENVEIVNPSSGSIANDSLQLKLLSRECYHENLANYMAPSEENLGERLAKVRKHRR